MAVSQSALKSATINQLIPLDFEEHAMRVTLDEHGAPWFSELAKAATGQRSSKEW